MTEKRTYSIDATGKKLGRVATEVASVLLGKDQTDFAKNTVAQVVVTVDNASKLDISAKQLTTKEYQRYSGYPGGRTVLKMAQVVDKKGYAELIRSAVYNMLPANRLRKPRLKNLIINE